MKKLVRSFIIVVFFTLIMTNTTFAGNQLIKVNTNDSTVAVNYEATDYSKYKVAVTKDNNTYYYNLTSKNEVYPLQMGNGKYTVSLYENVSGKKYKLVESDKINLSSDKLSVFLSSSQNINWDSNSTTSKLATKLTKDLDTDEKKVEAIYNYVIENIDYDYEEAYNVKSGYIPNPEEVLSSNKGICYDYSSLLAAMLRSQDIPTKLVKGTSTNTSTYHAWNEVYINGKWNVIDTTVDASALDSSSISLLKDSDNYNAKKIY